MRELISEHKSIQTKTKNHLAPLRESMTNKVNQLNFKNYMRFCKSCNLILSRAFIKAKFHALKY